MAVVGDHHEIRLVLFRRCEDLAGRRAGPQLRVDLAAEGTSGRRPPLEHRRPLASCRGEILELVPDQRPVEDVGHRRLGLIAADLIVAQDGQLVLGGAGAQFGFILLLAQQPPLPVDPELIRIITPASSDDSAGLHAMQRLIPSASPRHFLVPLPPGLTPDSPELFGFFVCEIRVGHADGWSTAHGRFGAPLRVTGVQYPAPTLLCQVARRPAGVSASAPFATPVLEGRAITASPPRSELWLF